MPTSLNRILAVSVFMLCAEIFPICAGAAEVSIDNGMLRVRVDGEKGGFSIETDLPQRSFAVSGIVNGVVGNANVVPVSDRALGTGQGIEISGVDGPAGEIMLFPDTPFALIRGSLRNGTSAPEVLNRVEAASFVVDFGKPPGALKIMGTAGLTSPEKCPGSYAWIAVAEPESRNGVVAGWLTQDRASGVLFPKRNGGQLTLEARSDYGRLALAPGKSAVGEILAVGYFADTRLGLEAWADAVAKMNAIKLPPPPTGFCTWYAEKFGGAANEKALAELADFAKQNLEPFGFNFVQIDDGWQMGEKRNGPRKNFMQFRADGPYPAGMKAAAELLKTAGLRPGIWFMPFAGTHNDPWFAEHQDWFVKNAEGQPYDNPWGGTSLDLTEPAVREYLRKMVTQISKDWGYSYFKMDGLYTGLAARAAYVNAGYKEDQFGDAVFFDPAKTNVEAFRDGLKIVRETANPGTFLLGCTAAQNMRTYQASFGLVDAMRTGPDNGGNWLSWVKDSPMYGARHYFLSGRIWYNDADPYYVRAGLSLDEARTTASWAAISGQLSSNSDWMPGLPPERVEILKRCLPTHRASARPVDYLDKNRPEAWMVTDERKGTRRDVLALFNWEDEETAVEMPLSRLGLPEAPEYAAFDFWANAFLPPVNGMIKTALPPHSCRILAIRPSIDHPFLLSTSRHVTQGMVEVSEENWDAAEKTLSGHSSVVGGDPYELRIFLPAMSPVGKVIKTELTREDKGGATVTFEQAGAGLRVNILSPSSEEISWKVSFATTN